MLGLLKKYEYHFYLPAELYYSVKEVNNKSLQRIFNDKKLIFEKLKYQKITDKLYYISLYFKKEIEKENFKIEINKFKELLPPWLVFPNIFKGSPRWNQGVQEDYCINNWLPYWNKLDFKEKQNYLTKYDCPNDWIDWMKENVMLS